ncbi:hypothetical protein [Chryseobacterium rhizosphaerae]|uniref:Helix-turn-helix domain-containing protein n=1 Tax=Chryseobacterium rhizosphaerae TaxID=395937 RepID=A0ABX9IHF5_9FLAO|nr:hypothetical protein [Chryseobacterium rhizosphaerae]MDC8101798.1 helix-turn-helix domain-containing protein [Chryseobacterium rhizosphaerae]MDR6547695.1 GT2 family glycosyltransferase [Chryseobacterium rhizosphaerae]REC71812.1 helix-turn-helix domain-containing protein [Chryseobacterium rhizosphaerae]GEN69169.1 hypothetical protein CRH01_37370 [Chryseobacterium rhizosphaerae]
MDEKVQKVVSRPNYKCIYKDIIEKKHPDKWEKCQAILAKDEWKIKDILQLDKILFIGTEDDEIEFNKKHRFYDESSILDILRFQKEKGYNNGELASHFNISRNTITKWKRLFKV